MPLILPGNVASATAGAYEVANSCRFNDPDTAYMSKTQSGGNRRTYTISFWFKKGLLSNDENFFHSYSAARDQLNVKSRGNDDIYIVGYSDSDSTTFDLTSAAGLFRDPTAWYHLVVAVDTTQGTAANRMKVYINGVQFTNWSGTPSYPAENEQTDVNNSGSTFTVGRSEESTGTAYYDGYIAEFCLIDGSALAPTSFGEFDEDSPTIWKPIDVSGLTFGTNGFYLDFEDSGNLGNDANGGTDFTETNLAAADQATDTPTNSFATLNPLYKTPNSLNFSEGNCQIQGASGNGGRFAGGTFCPDAGKWYMEIKVTVSGSYPIMGIIDSSSDIRENSAYFVAADSGTNQSGFAIFSNDDVYHNNDNTFDQWQTYATNDIIGLALDMDASTPTITFLKNNGSSEAFTTEAPNSGHYIFPAIGNYMQAAIAYCNFGGCSSFALTSAESDANGYGNFEYAPPSGYLAMCSKNIGENS